MKLQDRIETFSALGKFLDIFVNTYHEILPDQDSKDPYAQLKFLVGRSALLNPWFTPSNTLLALQNLSAILNEKKLKEWTDNYPAIQNQTQKSANIGIVMAGNIPLVGFHDFLCVLISGHKAKIKLSSADELLLPFIASYLILLNPKFKSRIDFVHKLSDMDGVIATGSSNTSRYFEFYFGKIPHIIRKNRNSLALLSGNESPEQLNLLGKDIFTYFGAGCRNVSKLFVPSDYNFDSFFIAMDAYRDVISHNKYANNYEYNRAIYLLKKIKHFDNGFLCVLENKSLIVPRAAVHFEYYQDVDMLKKMIAAEMDQIQCIVADKNTFGSLNFKIEDFGNTQSPSLSDYADAIDTLSFLASF